MWGRAFIHSRSEYRFHEGDLGRELTGAYSDSLDQAVKDDVAWLKSSRAIPEEIIISGWVYDTMGGAVRQVV
jgi:carbonic anhydrase